MASKGLRITGFARFLLVMVILAPLAYMGASYYNGEDGLQNLKNILGFGEKTAIVQDHEDTNEKKLPLDQSSEDNSLEQENKRLEEELEYKGRRIDELYEKIETLQRELDAKNVELQQLKEGQ